MPTVRTSSGVKTNACTILLREILSDDGSIYVHLDYKKCHYIKAVLDEVFGEENFQNEIVWERTNAHNMPTKTFARAQDTVFLYSKSDAIRFNKQRQPYGSAQLKRYKHDEDYLKRVLSDAGFLTPKVIEAELRLQMNVPEVGLAVVAKKPD